MSMPAGLHKAIQRPCTFSHVLQAPLVKAALLPAAILEAAAPGSRSSKARNRRAAKRPSRGSRLQTCRSRPATRSPM